MKHNWEYKRLGDVCEILNGYAFKSKLYISDSGLRVIRIANVQDGYISDEAPQYYPLSYISELNRYILNEGDLLMSLTGNVGRVGLLPKEMLPAALNQRVACLRFDSDLFKRFLFFRFRNKYFVSDCLNASKGIAQLNLSTEWLKEYIIPIPPMETQERIVAELDDINAMIEAKREQQKQLDLLAQSVFYTMFGDPVTNPKGWEIRKLTEVCSDITDGDHSAPPKSKDGIPFITISNIDKVNNRIDFTDSFFVPKSYFDALKDNRKPKIGDVLYTVTGSYGITVLIKDDKPFCFQRHIGLLRPIKNIVNSFFLTYWGRNESIKSYADNVATGIAQKTVSLNSLRGFLIIVPPLSLQNQFAAKVEAIEAQKAEIEATIKELQTLLDSRMDYWFN